MESTDGSAVDVVFSEARRRSETCFYDGGDDGRMRPGGHDGRSSYDRAQLMHRMLHRQADSFYDGRSCSGFCWLIVAGYQLSWRSAVRCVGLIHRDVEAGLFEFFLDIKFAAGLKLA